MDKKCNSCAKNQVGYFRVLKLNSMKFYEEILLRIRFYSTDQKSSSPVEQELVLERKNFLFAYASNSSQFSQILLTDITE